MSVPAIISSYHGGRHSADLEQTVTRLEADAAYKDLSTVVIVPAHKPIPPKVVASWLDIAYPPNNKVARQWALGMEVGDAYSRVIEGVLAHPELSKWKYILTLEHDNIPPPHGLVHLLAKMEAHPEFAAIGGLYFTKGQGGVAQIWGDPDDHPLNFRPQKPRLDGGLQECNGTGMGFTVFRLEMFKDERLRRPWFKTTCSPTEGSFSQDLYAWSDFHKHGFRCAIDTSVKVGHYDMDADVVW